MGNIRQMSKAASRVPGADKAKPESEAWKALAKRRALEMVAGADWDTVDPTVIGRATQALVSQGIMVSYSTWQEGTLLVCTMFQDNQKERLVAVSSPDMELMLNNIIEALAEV